MPTTLRLKTTISAMYTGTKIDSKRKVLACPNSKKSSIKKKSTSSVDSTKIKKVVPNQSKATLPSLPNSADLRP